MAVVQSSQDLEKWHRKKDPWDYENSPDDRKRKNILLSEIPQRKFAKVLDIGCGQGFITKDLPGENIIGMDISKEAIKYAKKKERKNLKFIEGSLFDANKILNEKFD